MTFPPSTYEKLFVIFVIVCMYPTCSAITHEQRSRYTTTTSSPSVKRCQNIYRNLTPEEKARFIDASGKPGSGIYGGNTLWYGSYSECQKIPESRYCWTMFPGSLSLVTNKTKSYHFEWGVCMPNECTNEDVINNFEFLFKNVSEIKIVTPFSKLVQVKCAEDPEYTTSVVITIVFCGVLVGICLLATTVELLRESYKPHKPVTVENSGGISMDKDENERMPLIPNSNIKVVNYEGLVYETLQSFSMIRNIKSIMNTNVGPSDLTYLHGIRVLSQFWIILFHVNFFVWQSLWPYDNLKDVIRFERRWESLVLTAGYGVDTFFVLSGLLVTYINMSKKTKNNGKTNWFKYYFHRFWRLTPIYMFWILFVAKLRPFFGAGPLWFAGIDTSACTENWWTNLLYLNNFIHSRKICMGHTWYLANDMQFFVISPIFILIAYRYGFRPLFCAVGVVVLASIIVTASIAADAKYAAPLVLGFTRLNIFFNHHQEELFDDRASNDFSQDVYIKPWSRIPPYVMGMLLGYVLYKHYAKKFKLPWIFVGIMWISAIALALTDIYGLYSSVKEDPRIWTTGEKSLFWSLKWPIWGLCILWLVFACHYNYAGLIKDILAAKFWIPLSHINYAAYIVHPNVILVLIYNIESPIHFTAFTMVTYFLSSLVLSYAIAFIITVVVGMPFANLEALAWKKWEKE